MPERKRFVFKAILFCVLLGLIVLAATALSTEQVASALGFATFTSRGVWTTGTTPPAYTTSAFIFLPLIMQNGRNITTYAAYLPGGPTGLQVIGTGGLFGFGLVLGLLMISEKPLWPFGRSRRE